MSDQTAVLTGGVALLERAIGYTMGSLRLVTPDALDRPTPCVGWDLRTLLMHMNDSLAALIEAADVGVVAVRQPSGPSGCPAGDELTRQLIQSLRDRAAHLLGAWCGTPARQVVSIHDRELTGGIVASTGAIEVAVHGWDVAESCGRRREIPSALGNELLDLAQVIITGEDRPRRFGFPIDVPQTATDGDRLIAFTGRNAS